MDMHTHAFPDKLAPRAVSTLEGEGEYKAVGSGTVAGLLASMDRAGIDRAVVCSIATRPSQVEPILKWSAEIRSARIEPFPSVHPKTPQAAQWVERFAREGFRGLKLHPMYQEFPVDAPEMDEVYAAAAERGLLVTAHCGRDFAFPPEDDRASPARLRRVIDRHPKLKLLCTHMGGWNDWEAVEQHLIGTHVPLETSFSLALLGAARAVSMMRRHGLDKIMLGSDWPWTSQEEEVRSIRTLGFTPEETDAILGGNAQRWLGP